MMMARWMMMMTFLGGNSMGVCKQTLIDEMDDFYGDDGRLKVTQQEVIDAMVRTYMKTPEYKKEHMDQEKSRLTD